MVEYEFYLTEYRGSSISREEWPGLEARARQQMEKWKKSMTISGDERAFAMAICALAESLRDTDSAGELRSAKIGSVSVEYRVRNREKQMLDRVGSWLEIYRGVG